MRVEDDAERPRESLDARIARLAQRQHGVFADRQAIASGATRNVIQRRIRAARWERAAPGVIRLAGTVATWRQSLMIACLAWGDGVAASHRAAAALWKVPDVGGSVELTVPLGRKRRHAPRGLVHRNALPAVDVTVVDAIPVTTPARTLIDLASVCTRTIVEAALDDALRRDLVKLGRIRWRLDELGRSGRPGIGLMRTLVEERTSHGVGTETEFERRLLRVMLDAGLPRPATQHEVVLKNRQRFRIDLAYPDQHLAIEADGWQWHSGRARWDYDQARNNELMLLGWRVIHVTWDRFTVDPEGVIAMIARGLERAASDG